ncbi:MAG TPA: DUF302 domain-containing protein [Pseudolabrys sp.]
MADDGLITVPSAHDFETTLGRLLAVLADKSIAVFARVDHAAGAADVGLRLRPTTLVVFGNPIAGTPLMEAAQVAGIDLPLKALVWQDADGTVKLTYNDPHWIATRHRLSNDAAKSVTGMSTLLAALAQRATGT